MKYNWHIYSIHTVLSFTSSFTIWNIVFICHNHFLLRFSTCWSFMFEWLSSLKWVFIVRFKTKKCLSLLCWSSVVFKSLNWFMSLVVMVNLVPPTTYFNHFVSVSLKKWKVVKLNEEYVYRNPRMKGWILNGLGYINWRLFQVSNK